MMKITSTKKKQLLITLFIFLTSFSYAGKLANFKKALRTKNTSDEDNSKTTKTKQYVYKPNNNSGTGSWGRRLLSQRFLRYPYQTNRAFNQHDSSPLHKKWMLGTSIEYNLYDDNLTSMTLDLDLAFAACLKLSLTSSTYFEKEINFNDSMNVWTALLGLDFITENGFSLDFRMGVQHVGDVDTNLLCFAFFTKLYVIKPIVFDAVWIYGYHENATSNQLKIRLGIIADFLGAYDFGIAYSTVRLGSAKRSKGITFSVRFWM